LGQTQQGTSLNRKEFEKAEVVENVGGASLERRAKKGGGRRRSGEVTETLKRTYQVTSSVVDDGKPAWEKGEWNNVRTYYEVQQG